MKKIERVTVFTGNDSFTIDLTNYDEIIDKTLEFEDHTEFSIACYRNSELVRRLWNPSCDISYLPASDSREAEVQMCEECGENPADLPSKLCCGCDVYRDHLA